MEMILLIYKDGTIEIVDEPDRHMYKLNKKVAIYECFGRDDIDGIYCTYNNKVFELILPKDIQDYKGIVPDELFGRIKHLARGDLYPYRELNDIDPFLQMIELINIGEDVYEINNRILIKIGNIKELYK